MKNTILSVTAILLLFVLVGCEKDNYGAPGSVLSGKVMYQDQAVGVRSNGTQLELWQYGFKLRAKIPVYIAQDGTYKATLFDGEYKLVRLSGAPWENQPTDTINVTVKGNTVFNVPVVPYFIIKNASFQKENNSVTAKFVIEKVSQTQNLELARLYLGKTTIVDQNNNDANSSLPVASITVGQETSITVEIPSKLASADYVFARIGVKTAGVGEQFYSSPQKIQLK